MIEKLFKEIEKHNSNINECKKQILRYFDLPEDQYFYDICQLDFIWKKGNNEIFEITPYENEDDPIFHELISYPKNMSNFVSKDNFSIAFINGGDYNECYFAILDNSKKIE